MRPRRLGHVLDRAVLVAMSAPTAVACGGSVSDANGAPDASSQFADVDWGQCSTVPSSRNVTNSCVAYYVGQSLTGSPGFCSAIPDGAIDVPLDQCTTLCPPLTGNVRLLTGEMGDASLDGSVVSCTVSGGPLILNDAGTMVLEGTSPYTDSVACTYPPQPGCFNGVGGRRPAGLVGSRAGGPDAAARFLAGMAYLEAASVDAFERLARELDAHGGPLRLQSASKRALRDEMRHARAMKGLARGAGARVPAVQLEPEAPRSLEGMAVENAVEGCVRETFGAAIAKFQGLRAGDPRVRRTMRRIALDETRHAALSWRVARWLETRLDADARARVREARTRGVDALRAECARDPDPSVAARLGVPSALQASRILDDLAARLWVDQAPSRRTLNLTRERLTDTR
jgi:hypothetical protein